MGQFRRLVFEYALKVKSKDEVFDEMLQLAQAAAGSGKLGDLPALKSLTSAGGLRLGDVEALKGLVTEALKAAGPALASRRAGSPGGVPAAAGPTSRPAPPPVSIGRKDMPSVLGTRVRTQARCHGPGRPEVAPARAQRAGDERPSARCGLGSTGGPGARTRAGAGGTQTTTHRQSASRESPEETDAKRPDRIPASRGNRSRPRTGSRTRTRAGTGAGAAAGRGRTGTGARTRPRVRS